MNVASSGQAGASAEVFTSVKVAGFEPTSKLKGVGTASLTLESEQALVSVSDTVNSVLRIQATGSQAQDVTLEAPSGVSFSQSSAASNVYEVRGQGQGFSEGAIVLASASGEAAAQSGASAVLESQQKLKATLESNSQLIFRADSNYEGSAEEKAYNDAVIDALASGSLASESVTELSADGSILADQSYFSSANADSDADVENRIVTRVRSQITGQAQAQAQGGHVTAFDADFVQLPARSADEVAVYVNGELAQRVSSASEVNQKASAGEEAYWVTKSQSRLQVLASTDSKAKSHTVTLAQVPSGQAAASTLTQLDARADVTSRVKGNFDVVGDLTSEAKGSGEVLGSFSSFFASEAQGNAEVREYSDVRSSTQIFSSINFAAQAASEASADVTAQGQGAGQAGAQGAERMQMDTSVAGDLVARATFTDSATAAIHAVAEQDTDAEFNLSKNVEATAVSDQVARLDGPDGTVGYMILAQAQGSGQASSSLDTSAASKVTAQLNSGEQVIFRSASSAQSQVNAELIAQAIAKGQVAGEANAGAVANAITSSSVDHSQNVDTSVVQEASATSRGQVTMIAEARGQVQQSSAVVLNADQSTLPAQTAKDIAVNVNGEQAQRVSSAAQVLAAAEGSAGASAQATYFVETTASGQSQILTSVPSLTSQAKSTIEVTSKLEAERKLNAAVDTFGSFKTYANGQASGKVVSMVAKPEASMLMDYTVTAKPTIESDAQATTVFDAVAVGSSSLAQAAADGKSQLAFESEEAFVSTHDTSSAAMRIVAKQSTEANFDLGSNVQTEAVTDNAMMLSAPDFEGVLAVTDVAGQASSQASLDASAAGQVTANLEQNSQVVFKAFSGFESELSQAQKEAQAKALASGKLLGHAVAQTDVSVGATATATTNFYGNVEAVTQTATQGKVSFLVNSTTSAGKTMIISLDPSTVEGLIQGEGEILVDGEAVPQADSYQDALDGEGDEYWLITTEGKAGLQALVSLDHFSTRTISIQEPSGPGIFLWTTIGLGIVVAAQAIIPRVRGEEEEDKW